MDLPADIYYRVINISSSYYALLDRLKKIENSVIYKAPVKDGQPHGGGISDPTARKTEKIVQKQEECNRKITAIERAWNHLGPIYKDFIKLHFFEHKAIERIDLPMSIQEKEDVRQVFLIQVARNLNEI
ncbi:MAG TPA: hypothetical protein DHW78_00655 [Ruminococcaceae bacterium]|nr:hypothetical protein [Oscillospiraceae bacterium]